MRCAGTVEFLCDFHNVCHNVQKDLESGEASTSEAPPTDKVENERESEKESDPESDKENVLPSNCKKRKGKTLETETKSSNSTSQEAEDSISEKNSIVEKTNDSLALDDLVTDKTIDISKEVVDTVINNKPNEQSIEKEKSLDLKTTKDTNLQKNSTEKISKLKSSVVETVTKNSSRKSSSKKNEKNENKSSKQSKIFSSAGGKNKKLDNNQKSKSIDKYFSMQSQFIEKSTNEENVNPNNSKIISNTNSDENLEQGKIIFEGTVINSSGDTSIIMPLKTESCNSDIIRFDDVIANSNEIVQAQEILWITNTSQLPEPGKPKTINSSQSKTTSPPPGDEAEIMETDGTLVVQTSGQDMNLTSSTEQLIVLEVQLPAKETSVALPKATAALRKRSLSIASSERRISEGKFAKISELMTEEQKQEIELNYTTDMSLVNESKVNENVITIDKCKYQCKICKLIYTRLDKCQVHIWRHLGMKPFLCKACDFSTLTISNIRCHIRKSHLKFKPFECHLCNKRYNSSTLLDEHLNIHTGARPYSCNICDFASTSKQVLAHHTLIHKSQKDIICDICGRAFYSKGRMRAHQMSHNKERAFKCTLCSTYLIHEEALDRHYANVHGKDYVCKICNKVYKSRKALHNHESVHSDAKFKCPMCPNVYKSTHILKEHILKHQGIRQYKCNKCSKAFAQQSHLAAHMAVHSDITYKCPGCNKGFNRHDNMKVHAKRCEKFLANPDLQSLLTKRKISFSKNNTAKVGTKKETNDLNEETKTKRKKTKSRSQKTATDKSVIEDVDKPVDKPVIEVVESINENVTIIENVLRNEDF